MTKPLAGMRVLVTAGPTREYIDPVRYLSNDSSGQMGFRIAAEAAQREAKVTLVHGPVALGTPPGVRAVAVVSAQEMADACRKVWPGCDALVMAAAVADYRPKAAFRTKHKKTGKRLCLALLPTEDILAALACGRRPGQVVIGFALEDRNGRANARSKLCRKKLDAIVLNTPAAIGAKVSEVQLLIAGGKWTRLPTADKSRHAAAIVDVLASLLAKRRAGRNTHR
ncbi:MAG: phosphopantothenoylcysteine decarboxylase [Planctomycetes bacterium]|nr:phosphopantothenoylcysteine decarboxylase [Planctomycetota bacterium]